MREKGVITRPALVGVITHPGVFTQGQLTDSGVLLKKIFHIQIHYKIQHNLKCWDTWGKLKRNS